MRSQEIDKLGESGSDIAARQAMGAIISSIRKAINRLAKMGFHQIVVAADHGFMYANYKGDDMKLENPGGSSTELHRRCWVGKGGHTPNGAVRVNASELGYGSDLDVIFPKTTAVFKAPGGLSFHHGGSSLQEMVVPAITVRISASSEEESKGLTTTISEYPNAITNRMFTMELRVSGDLFHQQELVTISVTLESHGKEVGKAIMAADGSVDKATGQVQLKVGGRIQLGLSLTSDDADQVRIVVANPATGAILKKTDPIPVRLGVM